uniref:Kinetochore protein SPC25 n=1 Tax=Gadus morhua TaxID=8049 RepID=A0A8C5BUJ5_GADMO
MASIKDPHVVDSFRVAMEEVYSRLLVQTSGEISEAAVELGLSHRRSMKSEFHYQMPLQMRRGGAVSHWPPEVSIGPVRCVVTPPMWLFLCSSVVVSQNRANKDRLKNLLKAKQVFQERLGLEIRRIHGQKLQFVFQNVNPASPENVYTFTMGINADGSYQIMSSDPVLESLGDLDKRLKQTNNISAFLANIRKEFVAQACFSTGS